MKKSEVATLKEYIKEKGTSVFNVAQSSGFPSIIQILKMHLMKLEKSLVQTLYLNIMENFILRTILEKKSIF